MERTVRVESNSWKFYYLLRVALNWILALLFPAYSAISYECSLECAEAVFIYSGGNGAGHPEVFACL